MCTNNIERIWLTIINSTSNSCVVYNGVRLTIKVGFKILFFNKVSIIYFT